jgi:hypothetical protein
MSVIRCRNKEKLNPKLSLANTRVTMLRYRSRIRGAAVLRSYKVRPVLMTTRSEG